MKERLWISIVCLVAGLGACGGDTNDGAADSGAQAGQTRGEVDANEPPGERDSGLGTGGAGGTRDAGHTRGEVDASEPPGERDSGLGTGERDSGLGAGGTGGAQDAGPGLDGGSNCERNLGSASMCEVCTADATCDAPDYTDNGDGTVTSSCCGLVWQQDEDLTNGPLMDGTYTLEEARAYCAALTLSGGGWRLPTIAELFSLVLLGQTPPDPTIDRTVFPNTVPYSFWSSSPCGGIAGCTRGISFEDGNARLYGAGSRPIRVRCVR